ncbi:hypothetical protein T484DRAFT_3634569 [Baffinella frigidus]|nr:hypothetical protein T484DRAFT_3634569 [Cryptophyta sp. CCMP2293]
MVGMTAFAAAPSACRPSSIAFTAPHLAGSSSSTVSGPAVAPQQRGGVRVLRASSDQQEEAERQGGRKGFYVRPSKALEKGGGFYVPGVDGSRLRLGLAGAAVLLLFVNRAITPGGADPEFSQLVSEATVVCTAAVPPSSEFSRFSFSDHSQHSTPTTDTPLLIRNPLGYATLGWW